jgi:cobalt-zinc-cadmium efflux system outer membrane protein
VREAFVALLVRQEQARILDESVADLMKIEAVVKGRAAAGDRSKYDVARIEAETRAVTVEAANARADIEDASGKLAITVGLPLWHPAAAGDLLAAPLATAVDALWETAQQKRPSIVAARLRHAAALAGTTVAHREALPIPALSAGTVLTHEEGGVSLVFGLSLPLPLFDRNQGAIAKSAAEAQAAELTLAAELAAVRAELVRATRVLEGRRAALEGMDKEVSERVPAMRRMAEDSYRDGKTGILDLLDAYRSLKEMKLSYLRQLESLKLAEAAVISAAGLDAVTE